MVVIGLSFTPSTSLQSNVSYATFIIIMLRINYVNYINNVNYSASYAQCVQSLKQYDFINLNNRRYIIN